MPSIIIDVRGKPQVIPELRQVLDCKYLIKGSLLALKDEDMRYSLWREGSEQPGDF